MGHLKTPPAILLVQVWGVRQARGHVRLEMGDWIQWQSFDPPFLPQHAPGSPLWPRFPLSPFPPAPKPPLHLPTCPGAVWGLQWWESAAAADLPSSGTVFTLSQGLLHQWDIWPIRKGQQDWVAHLVRDIGTRSNKKTGDILRVPANWKKGKVLQVLPCRVLYLVKVEHSW